MFRGVRRVVRYIVSITRICSLLFIALFLPKLFVTHIHSHSRVISSQKPSSFRLGLENLSDSFLKKLMLRYGKNFRIGLVTNQSGRDQSGRRTIDILLAKGLHVSLIFAPEHGIDGKTVALRDVENGKDAKSNIRVISLYRNGSTKKFDKRLLQDLDVLFFDIQDSGMRHYTYITTLFEMLESAALNDKTVVVFDRPNLLGPYMEGALVASSLKSAIPYASIPVRYGMTIGELALYFNKKILKKPAKLHVVPMKNYNRYSVGANGLLAHLSPNITSINSCYGYSFLGMLGEVLPFDIGIGTSRAFQCILLPETIKFSKKKWHELHVKLEKRGVHNSFYRYYSARKKNYCSGLRLHITDINTFSSFSTLLMVLDFFKKHKVKLTFSKNFDRALGTYKVREFFEGHLSKALLTDHVNKGLRAFFERASKSSCFLYYPFPKIVNLS